MVKSKKELFYDDFVEDWEKRINKTETSKRLRIVFEELLSGIPLKGKRFLEVGCGLGYFSKMAIRKRAQVTGLDIGEKIIERARRLIPAGKFIVGDAKSLPFKDETFDIVLCTEVIEHVESPSRAIKELFRVTKTGGYIVLTTPNRVFKSLFDFLSLIRVRPYRGNENWLYLWQIKKLLVDSRGEIIRERYFNFFYPTKALDFFEKFHLLGYLMINQGYLTKKT